MAGPEPRTPLYGAPPVGSAAGRGVTLADTGELMLGANMWSSSGGPFMWRAEHFKPDLVRREAVSRIQGDQQFAIKHGLIRDVAYQILPRAGRRERHAAVASFLQEKTGDVGQSTEALAHHWQEAGENQRAVDCLLVAADQAGRGWAKAHAVALYRAALGLIPADVPRHAEVKRQLAVALMADYHVDDAQHLRSS